MPRSGLLCHVDHSRLRLVLIFDEKTTATATLYINQSDIVKLNLQQTTMEALLDSKQANIEGDASFLTILDKVLTDFDPNFEIVPLPTEKMIEDNRVMFINETAKP